MTRWRRITALAVTGLMVTGLLLGGCGKTSGGSGSNHTQASSKAEAESSGEQGNQSASQSDASVHASTESTSSAADTSENTTDAIEIREIEAPVIGADAFPILDGSTATLPLGRMMYRMCTGADENEAETAISFTKTTNSYLRLMDGEADLLIAYEAGPKAKEDARYEELLVTPVGLDALVFLCNEENPVESLATQQIKEIYTGKITNWKQVGGEDSDIIAFQRPQNSGSQTLMENLMMQGTPMMEAPEERKPSEMGELIDAVASYENSSNALGFSVYYYASQMHQVSGVRLMGVDGVMPEAGTIRSGEYGYVNPFYVVIRKDTDHNSTAWKLYEWLTGEDGQSLVAELGYVSVEAGTRKLPAGLNAEYISYTSEMGRLVLDGEVFDGTAGIVVFDENMQPKKRYNKIRIPVGQTYCIARGSVIPACEPVEDYLEGTKDNDPSTAFPIGLFDLDAGRWVVEPQYVGCYWKKAADDSVQYILYSDTAFYGESSDGTTAYLYSTDGEPEGTVVWYDYDDYCDMCPWLYLDSELNEDVGGYSRYFNLGGSSFATKDSDGRLEVYVKGKLKATYESASVLPYEAIMIHVDDLPYNYKHVYPYNGYYDETKDEWVCEQETHLLINDKGEIAQEFTLNPDESILLLGKDYLITYNYKVGCYQIKTYDGGLIYQWTYTEYGETEYLY